MTTTATPPDISRTVALTARLQAVPSGSLCRAMRRNDSDDSKTVAGNCAVHASDSCAARAYDSSARILRLDASTLTSAVSMAASARAVETFNRAVIQRIRTAADTLRRRLISPTTCAVPARAAKHAPAKFFPCLPQTPPVASSGQICSTTDHPFPYPTRCSPPEVPPATPPPDPLRLRVPIAPLPASANATVSCPRARRLQGYVRKWGFCEDCDS